MKTAKKRIGSRQAFTDAWNRIATGRDSWGVKCVYDHGGQLIWEAAIRFERRRRSRDNGSAEGR